MSLCWRRRHCNYMNVPEEALETSCNCVQNDMSMEHDECECGFEEEYNGLPTNPQLAQSYVPVQKMERTFKPCVGLKKGTIFPELVSPYCPNQSVEEIEYIKMTNKIGEGCNK